MTTNPTVNFQIIWTEILSSRDINLLDKAKILIEEGANINISYGGYLRSIRSNTPLYYLLLEYFRNNTYYLNDDILDDLLWFLFENNVMPDENSLRFCINRDTKLLEELSKRSEYNEFIYTLNPLSLETILGFSRLDTSISYNFSYLREDNYINYIKYLLPIECIFLDFIIKKGLTTEGERKDIIHILKRNDSPSPCIDKLNKIISEVDINPENNKKLEEYYNYYNEYKI
jgi:hypothetical protein